MWDDAEDKVLNSKSQILPRSRLKVGIAQREFRLIFSNQNVIPESASGGYPESRFPLSRE
jgi:hypothetical protein